MSEARMQHILAICSRLGCAAEALSYVKNPGTRAAMEKHIADSTRELRRLVGLQDLP